MEPVRRPPSRRRCPDVCGCLVLAGFPSFMLSTLSLLFCRPHVHSRTPLCADLPFALSTSPPVQSTGRASAFFSPEGKKNRDFISVHRTRDPCIATLSKDARESLPDSNPSRSLPFCRSCFRDYINCLFVFVRLSPLPVQFCCSGSHSLQRKGGSSSSNSISTTQQNKERKEQEEGLDGKTRRTKRPRKKERTTVHQSPVLFLPTLRYRPAQSTHARTAHTRRQH